VTRMRVADVIASILVDHGVSEMFMLTGGGSMHLNDAFGRAKGLRKVYNHHEQASAMAAESYGRLLARPAGVCVTTGPGGVNTLNGVYGAYTDSIPMIVISGQVKRETVAENYPIPLRQLGDQEIDIISMVRGITKYAVMLQNPSDVRKVTEKAIHLAMRGRPGPVWIDVPVDVQGAPVEFDSLEPYDPTADDRLGEAENTASEEGLLCGSGLDAEVAALLAEIHASRRPVVLAGAGIRLSGSETAFVKFLDRLGMPVVTGWNAHDAVPNTNPLFVGRPGSVGDRGGNFAVQSADYVLVLGSRLNIRQISYNWQSFAKNAKVAMVEIDATELAKPTLSLHRPIHADLRDFFAAVERAEYAGPTPDHVDFLRWCRERAAKYPVVLDEYWDRPAPVNPYCFGKVLFDSLEEGDIVVTANGTACVTIFQCAYIKPGQRLYTNSGSASMGYDLPAAIGAYYASNAKRIICLAGDGSVMQNLQELQTIVGGQLPIKIFVLNNDGYQSIRHSQQNHFPDNVVGCGPDDGLNFPNFHNIAHGFGIPASRISSHGELAEGIAAAIGGKGPALCEVMIDGTQQFAPKLAARRLEDGSVVSPSLEDMAPFLPREELDAAMSSCESVN